MSLRKIFASLTVLLFTLSSSSCLFIFSDMMEKSHAERYITVERGAIPPYIGSDNSVLLIVLFGRSNIDKNIRKVVNEEYHGEHEFATMADFQNGTFKDSDKYKYVYMMMPEIHRMMNGESVTTFKYSIMDTRENTSYPSNMTSSAYKAVTKVYMINLEKQRLKNQKN